MDLVGVDRIREAAALAPGVWVQTPVEHSRLLSGICGGPVHLKCENLQRTGSFKIRGAYTRIHGLSTKEKAAGVVAASAGNHAQGVALGASMLGVTSTVFMPSGAAIPKVEATRRYGAEVVLTGKVYDDAFEAAATLAGERGAVVVHPFDHEDIIAGQGTVALEILQQIPDVKSIVVPVGGGGLISGVAAATKGINPAIKIVGVEPSGSANVAAALAAGKPVELDRVDTIADGLAAKFSGELTLRHVEKLVDELVTVTDEEIAGALLMMVERAKLVVEPAGAAGVAAAIYGRADLPKPCVIILSGGNVDPLLLLRVIRFGLSAAGRYYSFRTMLSDTPGELHRLLGVIADAGGNVIGIDHHRAGATLRHVSEVEVGVQVETRGSDHVESLKKQVRDAGYQLVD